jgi:hypothetical protein
LKTSNLLDALSVFIRFIRGHCIFQHPASLVASLEP